MRHQFIGTIAILFFASVAGYAHVATPLEPGRYTALTTRQLLGDEVTLAMADGQISRAERIRVLGHAKLVLKADEYASFRENVDRISPPKPVMVKHPVKVVQKPAAAAKQPVRLAQRLKAPLKSPTGEVTVSDKVVSRGATW